MLACDHHYEELAGGVHSRGLAGGVLEREHPYEGQGSGLGLLGQAVQSRTRCRAEGRLAAKRSLHTPLQQQGPMLTAG